MPLSPLEYLRHILDETAFLSRRAASISKDQFMSDEELQRAFVRSLEVIGDTSKRVPSEFRDKYPSVEWRAMARMRDRLIHDYFGVALISSGMLSRTRYRLSVKTSIRA
jgi:uncharacterized protein with HEPN domain